MVESNDERAAASPPRDSPDMVSEAALVADESEVLVLDFAPDGADGADSLVLTMRDLLPDDAGEVVVLADGDLPVSLLTGEGITESGIASDHVTASGLEVSGLQYYSFESGITVYGPPDLLIVTDHGLV